MTEPESVCYVVPGQERLLANALGGTYELEGCGFFFNCDDTVRKYFESAAGWDYVEVWTCAPDTVRVTIGAVLVLISVAIAGFAYLRIRRKLGASTTDGDIDLDDFDLDDL